MSALLKALAEVRQQKGADVLLSGRRLTAMVDLLRDFFNAEGNGLDYAEMDSGPTYKVRSCDGHVMTM